jgi:hypothetical protein
MGFADGTLAAYDATAILRDGRSGTQSSSALANSGTSGEINHFKNLHGVLTGVVSRTKKPRQDSKADLEVPSQSITAAAFMPGRKTRAVSVGIDGKCKMVDFAGRPVILRTWSVKGSATCVSVTPLRIDQRQVSASIRDGANPKDQRRKDSKQLPGPATKVTRNTDNLIAIGRADGRVLVFDSLGSLLNEQSVDDRKTGRIIDVEWIKGTSPKSLPRPKGKPSILTLQSNASNSDDSIVLDSNGDSESQAQHPSGLKRKRSRCEVPNNQADHGERNAKRKSSSPPVENTVAND